jgi:SAM-dependent methyltransferase
MAPARGASALAPDDVARIASDEASNWWFTAKRRLAVDMLRSSGVVSGPVIDVGAGGGALVGDVVAAGLGPAVGVEPDAGFGRRPGTPIAQAVAEHLPLRHGAAAAVLALDVVEHLDDDVAAVRSMAEAVRPGGVVVLAVPAYRWAWSAHDVRLGHRRRYSRADVRRLIDEAGLDLARLPSYHSWLVPVAAVVRRGPLGRRRRGGSGSGSGRVGARLNRLLLALADAERRLLRHVDLPVGLSIMAVARTRS